MLWGVGVLWPSFSRNEGVQGKVLWANPSPSGLGRVWGHQRAVLGVGRWSLGGVAWAGVQGGTSRSQVIPQMDY